MLGRTGRRVVAIALLALVVAAGVSALWPSPSLAPLAAPVAVVSTSVPRQAPSGAPPVAVARAEAAAVDAVAGEALREPATAVPNALREHFAPAIRALANDHIRGNAVQALRDLHDPAAVPLLREALAAPDRQQRQLAALVLRNLADRPCARLAEVSVEALRGDVARELASTLAGSVSVHAARWLYRHRDGSAAVLRSALCVGDESQRFLAAFLLGAAGETADVGVVVRELVGHLGDNQTDGDALMAAHALFHLGPSVAPLLHYWRPGLDAQGQQLIDLVLLDLRDPPRSRAQLVARSALQGVTGVYHDPAVEFDIDRSSVATR